METVAERTEMGELKVSMDFTSYPTTYTCDGDDLSPPFRVEGLSMPYIAVILDDPDASNGPFTHWMIWNIAAKESIPAGISTTGEPDELKGARQGINSSRSIGYTGPCPPRGRPHHYHLKVYGLDAPLDLPAGASKQQLEKALRSHARQFGEFVATYQR